MESAAKKTCCTKMKSEGVIFSVKKQFNFDEKDHLRYYWMHYWTYDFWSEKSMLPKCTIHKGKCLSLDRLCLQQDNFNSILKQ